MVNTENQFILRASRIDTQGVGCFATEEIPQGTRLHPPEGTPPNRHLTIDEIPDSHLKYCPLLENGLYLAPGSFSIMSIFWYINHDRKPNIITDRWKLFAARDIESGEELTMYYPDLLTHPKNKDWVVPEIHI